MGAFGEIRDPLIGTRIDSRYLVKGVLGRGGMGVVYDGIHEQLGRPVAIKVLGAGIASDPIAVERFLREARTASQLTHGNIVDVSDLGRLPDGRPYLVMARMHGMDLCTLLQREGPQTPRRTAELLRGAAAALDLIHAKGFVHRDVKPENLMHVVREDGSEAVLLLDFGIVGLVSGAAARLTADGTVFGTPAYLPPELIQGDEPDRRADVYSLATVAFELMTGRTPFVATNPLRILPMKVLEEPPSMRTVAGYDYPEALEEALAKGLARDPKERFASAGEFVAALESASLLSAPGLRAHQLFTGELEKFRREPTIGVGEYDPAANANPLDGGTQTGSVARGVRSEREPVSEIPVHELSEAILGGGRRRSRLMMIAGVAVPVLLMLLWLGLRDSTPEQAGVFRPSGEPAKPGPAADSQPQPAAALAPSADLAAERMADSQPTAAAKEAPPSAAAEPSKRVAALQPAAPSRATAAAQARTAPTSAPPMASQPAPKKPEPSTLPPIAARRPLPEPPATPSAAAAASGPTATELTQAAQRELIQGHLAAAADLYSQATRLDPRSEPAWRGLGLAQERLGRKAEAAKALRRAIELAPNGPNAATLKARLDKLSH
jgi:eukaryotic-like serine/threonine-protein kinase